MTKIFGEGDTEVRALDNVSLSIKRGEFVLIVGSSGSGKSTLLNMIGLLDRPTNGKIVLDNIETTQLNDSQISEYRNKKLGFIFQFSNLLQDLSVIENVMLPQQIKDNSGDVFEKAKQLLVRVGLEDQIPKRANKISGGQAQRVAIARGLVNNPAIVLADEPTGNLDVETSRKVFDELVSLVRGGGLAAVIATHDRELASAADRTFLLREGNLISQ